MKTHLIKSLLLVSLSIAASNSFAELQCYVSDVKGHTWGSAGSTEERAYAVAQSFCESFSPDSSTCKPTKCTGG